MHIEAHRKLLDRDEGLALSALFHLALRCVREHGHLDAEVNRLAVQAGPLVFRLQAELHSSSGANVTVH